MISTIRKATKPSFGTTIWTIAALPILPGALLLYAIVWGADTRARRSMESANLRRGTVAGFPQSA